MRDQVSQQRNLRGFSLIELATVIVIIGILITIVLPVYSSYQERAAEAKCLANLRGLYMAASSYLLQNKSWPQIPPQLILKEPKTYARSWVEVLRPFGVPHSSWICPKMQKELHVSMEDVEKDENYRIDYIASAFGEDESAPRRRARHPWFMEKSGFHPRGNLMILADGSTMALRDFVGK